MLKQFSPTQPEHRQGKALNEYFKAREDNVAPSIFITIAALKECSISKGRVIHNDLRNFGEKNIVVGNALVGMYSNCGNMIEALEVFEDMQIHDETSWAVIILGFVQNGDPRMALQLYDRMQERHCIPNRLTFVSVLKACAALAGQEEGKSVDGKVMKLVSWKKGKAIHSQLVTCGHEFDIFVGNTLVDMYSKCGSLVDASRVFEKLPRRDVVLWNCIIMGYAQNGEGHAAMEFFQRMQDEGEVPNRLSFVAALKACASIADKDKGQGLQKGKAVHSQVAKRGYESDISVANTLVDMYAKCGSMGDARSVFDSMPYHTVVSWNCIIMGYAQNEQAELALQLYACMSHKGCVPDRVTFLGAMKACSCLAENEATDRKIKYLDQARSIHNHAARCGHESNTAISNTLIDLYAKCGSMMHARAVFELMPHWSVVSWSCIILGYAQNGEGDVSLQLYEYMQEKGYIPNRVTFLGVLKACGSLAEKEHGKHSSKCLEQGRAIHKQIAKSGYDTDITLGNSLIDMYSKCGSMSEALQTFEKMPRHDVVSWTSIILGYANGGEGDLALDYYTQMQGERVLPTRITFLAALKACASLGLQEEGKLVDGKLVKLRSLKRGKAVHCQAALTGEDVDMFVANTLIDMYAKCGSMSDAWKVFESIHPDTVAWNCILLGYAENGECEFALELYSRMQEQGVIANQVTWLAALKACSDLAQKAGKHAESALAECLQKGKSIHSQLAAKGENDIVVSNTLIDMYAKCGSMVDACSVFELMSRRDLVTWSCIILGYAESGKAELALQFYTQMRDEGFVPDRSTYFAVLKACTIISALETGRKIHAEIRSSGLDHDGFIASSLVVFYGKCGSMVDAQQVFDGIAKKDLVAWTALLAGYSCHGDTQHVFDLFESMQKEHLQADDVTVLSILNACSHAGLVERGREFFDIMQLKYSITPIAEHYNCMVDLYGRANRLDDAVAILKSMPFQPSACIWMTVLGACHKWTNVALGKLAFDSLLRLDQTKNAAYLLMANIYANTGMWSESAHIKAMNKQVRV